MSNNIKSKESKPEKIFREWVQRLMLGADDELRRKHEQLQEAKGELDQQAFEFYSELYGYTTGDFVMNGDDNIFYVVHFDPKAGLFMGRKLKKDGQWSHREEYFDMARGYLSRKLDPSEVESMTFTPVEA